MPRQFVDFSDEVAGGSNKITGSLEGIIAKAGEADVVSSALSVTQEHGAKVTDAYSKSLDTAAKGISAFSAESLTAAKEMATLSASVKDLGLAMSQASGMADELGAVTVAVGQIQEKLEALAKFPWSIPVDVDDGGALGRIEDRLDSLEGRVVGVGVDPAAATNMNAMAAAAAAMGAAVSGVQGLAGALGSVQAPATGPVDKWLDELKSKIGQAEAEVELLSDATDKLGREAFVVASVDVAELKAYEKWLDILSQSDKEMFAAEAAANGLEAALDGLKGKYDTLAKSIEKQRDAAEELARTGGKLKDEIDKVGSVSDLLKKQFQSGKKEAEQYAEGLGANSGALVGAGVAAVYLTEKLGGLVDKFQDGVIEMRKFSADLAVLESTAFIGLETGGLDDVRKKLNLTRAQAGEFFTVLKDGANSGVANVEQLVIAAGKLQETFGGDPTKRLEEYVGLLKSIPTLETDFAVTATMDDRAASLFALAEEGKIDVALEMQTAGLLGGVQVDMVSPEDLEMLDATQRAAAAQESWEDLARGLFPPMAANIGVVAGLLGNVFGGIGGIIAGLGVMKIMLSSQTIAQNATTAAVYQTAKMEVPGGGAGGGGIMGTVKALGKSLGVVGVTAAVVAVGLAYLSKKLGDWSDEAAAAGDKTRALKLEMGSAAASVGAFTAAGAAIGSLVPVIGTFAGAVVGAGVGVVVNSKKLADSLHELTMTSGVTTKALKLLDVGLLGPLGLLVPTFSRLAASAEDIADRAFGEALLDSTKDFRYALAGLQTQQHKSAKAYQRLRKETENIFETAKVKLSEFNKDLAGLKLKRLKNLGGTMEDFDSAIAMSAESARSKFKMLTDGLAEARAKIIADTDASATERAQSLRENRSKQLKATNEFVDAMDELNKAILETPDIIRAGLQREMAGIKLGFAELGAPLEAGGFLEAWQEQIDAARAEYEAITAQAEEARKISEETLPILKEQEKAERKAIAARIGTLDNALKDSLTKVGLTVKGEGKEATLGADVNMGEAKKMKERVVQLGDEIESIKDGLPTESFAGLVFGLKGISTRLEQVPKELNAAQVALAKAKKDGVGVKEAQEGVNIALKEQEDLEAQKAELAKKLNVLVLQAAGYSKKDIDLALEQKHGQAATNKLLGAINQGKSLQGKDLLAYVGAESDNVEMVKGVTKFLGDSVSQFNKLNEKTRELDVAQTTLTIVEDATKTTDKIVATQRRENETQNARLESLRKLQDFLGQIESSMDRATMTEQAMLDQRTAQTRIASLTVGSENALAEQMEAQRKLVEKRFAVGGEAIAKARAAIAKALKEKPAGYEADVLKLEQSIAGIRAKQADMVEALGMAGDQIDAAMEQLQKSVEGRRFKVELDLSETLGEFAEFSENGAAMMRESTKIAIDAAKRRADAEKRTVERMMADERAGAEQRIRDAGLTGGPAAASATRAEEEATLAAKKRLEFAKIEVGRKKAVVEAAQREADFAMEGLDIRQQVIDAELDFLSETGGAFSSILERQQESISIERDKLEIQRKQLETVIATDGESRKTQIMSAKIVQQEYALRKKEIGVQKDIMEKVLGAAFGEINAEAGAAKRRTSDVALLGREMTRAVTASGAYAKTEPGQPTTIDQRAAARQLAGGFGGMESSLDKLTSEAPERLSVEEEMAQNLRGVDEKNAEVVKNTAAIAQTLTVGDSAHVHDEGTHSLLESILAAIKAEHQVIENAETVAKEQTAVGATAELAGATPGEMAQPKVVEEAGVKTEQASADMAAGVEDLAKMEEQKRRREVSSPLAGFIPEVAETAKAGAAIVEGQDKTGMGTTAAANGPVVPDTSTATTRAPSPMEDVTGPNFAARPGIGAAPGAGGAGAKAAEVQTIRVTGEMMVRFDNKIFRDQVVTIVGRAITTGEVRKAMENSGVVFK